MKIYLIILLLIILFVLIYIYNTYLNYSISNNSTNNCPTFECPKIKYPNFECPEVKCPKLECPKLECPKLECPKLECPINGCTNNTDIKKNFNENYNIEQENNPIKQKIYMENETNNIEQQNNYIKQNIYMENETNNIEQQNNYIKQNNYMENENVIKNTEHIQMTEIENNYINQKLYIENENENVNENNINDISYLNNNECLKLKNIDNLLEINNLSINYPSQINECDTKYHSPCEEVNIISKYLNEHSECKETFKNSNIISTYLDTNIECKEEFTNLNDNINFKYDSQMRKNLISENNKLLPRYIWIYWENVNRSKYPTFIKLCMDSMKKHLGTKYSLIFLNEKKIKEYLPELRNDFDNLRIEQKVDYYRIELLYKYGGIWLDSDIIIMTDLKPIFDKLDSGYDFVGFGCTGNICTDGYFRPSNWVMGAKKHSLLKKKFLTKLNEKLDKKNINEIQNDSTYHNYGKNILWDSLDELKLNGYYYYHFSSEYDGARDINANWIHAEYFFNTNQTKFLNESKLLFVVLYNSEISQNPKYNWIYDCPEERLLYGNEWICSLFRKSLYQ